MNILAIIPARIGSKGIPKKNLLTISGYSLVERALFTAINTDFIDDAIVSTDSKKIQNMVNKYGNYAPFIRPEILATDTAGSLGVIQHPVTTEVEDSFFQIKQTVDAINELNIQTVALLPNNDAGHLKIIDYIKKSSIKWYPSLPTNIFINLYRNVKALIGNSSSGIHETPTIGIPAINIGNRQQGRERASNVIDVPYSKNAIVSGINKALSDTIFLRKVKKIINPYGEGKSAEKIVKILKTISLDNLIQKQFVD